MKKLFEAANQYARESDWRDFALLKICLCALGVAIGVNISSRHRKAVTGAAAAVFTVTCVPLMAKFLKIILRENAQ